jgi:hypothetical protein
LAIALRQATLNMFFSMGMNLGISSEVLSNSLAKNKTSSISFKGYYSKVGKRFMCCIEHYCSRADGGSV